jgi:hypothetical protein
MNLNDEAVGLAPLRNAQAETITLGKFLAECGKRGVNAMDSEILGDWISCLNALRMNGYQFKLQARDDHIHSALHGCPVRYRFLHGAYASWDET